MGFDSGFPNIDPGIPQAEEVGASLAASISESATARAVY